MTGDELQRALRSFTHRRPFRPFYLRFFCGDQTLLPHPESIDRNGDLFICRGTDKIHRIFAATSVCQVLEWAELPREE